MYLMWRLLLPLVVTTLLIVGVVQAEEEDESITMDEAIQALEAFASNCDPVPKREHMEELLLHKKDPQLETKCLCHCLMVQFDMVEEGSNQMVKEKMKEILEMIMPDNEAAANEMIDTCNKKNAAITDKCEAAHEHSMCILEECKSRGVKMPEVRKE